jgi:ribonuclease P protein component
MGVLRTGSIGPRLGVVVSSRFLPRAVDRNQFKRIVREAFRTRRAELPACDVLIRLKLSLKAMPHGEWQAGVRLAVERLLASIGS